MRRLLAIVALAAVAGAPCAWADQPVARELVIQNHRFKPDRIEVPAGQRADIHVTNKDQTAEEFDSDDLRVEKVIAGHSDGTVHLHPLAAGEYTFMGEYHPYTAHGAVVAK